jgi:hypothetical protein
MMKMRGYWSNLFFNPSHMYEHKKQPLASKTTFYNRMGRNLMYSMLFLGVCLAIGTIGFKMVAPAHYNWFDCFHNASMLLSGMGPVIIDFPGSGGKVFSSLYALFSGIAFITNVGVLLAPVIHRFFHKLHLDDRG